MTPLAASIMTSTTGTRFRHSSIPLQSGCASVMTYLMYVYKLQSEFLQKESEKWNSCKPALILSIRSLSAQ